MSVATELSFPDPATLVASSEWMAAMPGLRDAAARWQRTLPAVRRQLEAEAADLARPRLWVDTLSSLAATGWKIAAAAAPDAPVALLSAAAAAAGLPIAPPRAAGGTVRRAERLVRAGGPAYIKLGQFISSAKGLLPDEWVEAFAWCRDRAPELPLATIERVLDEELGEHRRRIEGIDPEPLAAGSIAQVHGARLDTGQEVVIKVRRPGLRRQLRTDIENMALVAAVAERFSASARMANLGGFVELFASLVLQELDFRLESLNLVEIGAAFEDAGIDYCVLPRPIPDLVTEGLLVMERVSGVPYDQAAERYGAALDGERMLRLAVQGVLETTLIYGVFHGDLHAGNVFVDGGDRFALVDFGICGRLKAEERAALVAFMLAFSQWDAGAMLTAMEPFGGLPPDVPKQPLAARLQQELDRLDPAAGGGLTYDRVGDALGGTMHVLTESRYRMPKELVLFFKNLLYLTGFTASIAPDTDLLSLIGPILGHFLTKYGAELAALMPLDAGAPMA